LINQAKIYASNFEETRNFYKKLLPKVTNEVNDQLFELNFPANTLSVEETKTTDKPFYHFAFLIPYHTFDSAKAYVSKHVALNIENGKDEVSFAENIRSLYFYDPAGNVVEFIGKKEEDKEPDKQEFSEDAIHCLTEMSLVTANMEQTLMKLKQVGLSDAIGSVDSNDLVFLFSDNSSLLISPDGRDWVFSDKPAEVFPQEIDIKGITITIDDEKNMIVE